MSSTMTLIGPTAFVLQPTSQKMHPIARAPKTYSVRSTIFSTTYRIYSEQLVHIISRHGRLTSPGNNQPNNDDITRHLVKLIVLIQRITSHFRIIDNVNEHKTQ